VNKRFGLLGIAVAILVLISLILAAFFCVFPWGMSAGSAHAGDLPANPDQWIVYFPKRISDVCRGVEYSSAVSDTLGDPPPWRNPSVSVPAEIADSLRTISETVCLVRPSGAPGKPLPLRGWTHGVRWEDRFRASARTGMFAIERDSCSGDAHPIADRICIPTIGLIDTSGVCRKTFVRARDPVWSPDGTRLAFRTVRVPTMRKERETYKYPEAPESLAVFSPITGRTDVYPAPAEAISWADNETLFLEMGARRYGIKLPSGEPYHPPTRATAGSLSPDLEYSFRSNGKPQIWKGKSSDIKIWSIRGDRDISPDIIQDLGQGIASVSVRSFWLRGQGHKHDLCLGLGWMTRGRLPNLVTKYSGCEVIVVDVEEKKVIRRIHGAFVGPSADETHVVVWRDGRLDFLKL
jgi:WD40 repeat protein